MDKQKALIFTGVAVTVASTLYIRRRLSISSSDQKSSEPKSTVKVSILYGTQFGTSKKFAQRLVKKAKQFLPENVVIVLKTMNEFDPEDLAQESIVICILSTVEG